MIARNGRIVRHQDRMPTSQDWCLPLRIYKQGSSVRESRRKTRRHVTILSRLGTVASLIGWRLLVLGFWLAGESVWTNEELPRLPVGLTPLAAVILLHNTLAWEAVWAEQDFLLVLLSNTSRMSFQSQGLYELRQFWQMTSACCMRGGILDWRMSNIMSTVNGFLERHTNTCSPIQVLITRDNHTHRNQGEFPLNALTRGERTSSEALDYL